MVFTPVVKNTLLRIDREQAQRQLELLGYRRGERVCLTAFFPKHHPRTKGKNRDKGRKSNRLKYAEVEKWQNEGRGVYFAVNGAHKKEDVKQCRAIFYEHDDLDKETQKTLWQTLGLPEPTLQVDTGGKSIHSYWVFDEPIHPDLWATQDENDNWQGIQADLLELADADRSLTNPNRVMRLAGCHYMTATETGSEPTGTSHIIGGCGKRYSYAELRGLIPRHEHQTATSDEPMFTAVPSTSNEPLDFREVGHLLPEWNERGRRGWATFQCPVHTTSGKHSDDHIHVNLTSGKWEAHCGCDRKLIYQTICQMVGHNPKASGQGWGTGSSNSEQRPPRPGGSGGGDGGSGGGNGSAEEPIDPTERQKLELKALAQERDYYRYINGLINFCRRTGWTRRDAEQQIRLLKTSVTKPKAKWLRGKDFLALETESISWVFPGIIPSRGVSVIGGHAGAGKTTLAYDAVGSLLLNQEFLGEAPVKTGKVLIVTGDELPCFTQDKLIDRGIPLDNDNWDIILNWDVSQWELLEEAVADIRPSMIVVDSFSSIHRDPNFDENSSQAKATIFDLEALTNAYGCGCILIHHLSKSKENRGVTKLRGSSAISAAASVVMLMEELSDGCRKLSFPKIRGAQTEPMGVALDESTGRYIVLSGGDTEDKSLAQRILDFLIQNPYKRYEQSEIVAALGISNGDSAYRALSRLFRRGQITKRPSKTLGKNGKPYKVYGVQNSSQLSQCEGLRSVTDIQQDTLPPPRLKVSDSIPESIINTGIEQSDTNRTLQPDTNRTLQPDSELSSWVSGCSNLDSEGDTAIEPDTLTERVYESCSDANSDPELSHTETTAVRDNVQNPSAIAGMGDETDYDEFPHSNPSAVWGVKKDVALRIKTLILAIDCQDDYFELKNDPQYTREQLNWVLLNCLTKQQREFLTAIVEEEGRSR